MDESTVHPFDKPGHPQRFRMLPDISIGFDVEPAQTEALLDAIGEPGSITLTGLHDWREPDPNPIHVYLGTWGRPGPIVVVGAWETGRPCPVCGMLGGFHDTDDPAGWHAGHVVPRRVVRPITVNPGRPKLTDDEIAERREAARLRREAGS